MKLRYILVTMMILLIPLLAFGLDIDEDSNDAVDIAYGGTNAITAAAALTNLGQNAGTDITADLEEETHADEHLKGGADPISRLFEGVTVSTIVPTGAGADTDGIVVSGSLYNTTGLTITFDNFVDEADGDESTYSDGDFFGLIMNASTAKIDFSDNANIEGNANTDYTGSSTQIMILVFVYEDSVWKCINLNSGFSDPLTMAVGKIQGANNIITDTDGIILTTAQMNSVVIMTGAGEVQLPDVCDSATGEWVMVFVRDVGEQVEMVVTDTSDQWVLSDGSVTTANDEADLAVVASSFAVFMCLETNKWYVMGERGTVTDGGAAD